MSGQQSVENDAPKEGRILNPGAVGNPDETPMVQVSPALARHFERTRCPECGYINHCHTDDCGRGRCRDCAYVGYHCGECGCCYPPGATS